MTSDDCPATENNRFGLKQSTITAIQSTFKKYPEIGVSRVAKFLLDYSILEALGSEISA